MGGLLYVYRHVYVMSVSHHRNAEEIMERCILGIPTWIPSKRELREEKLKEKRLTTNSSIHNMITIVHLCI